MTILSSYNPQAAINEHTAPQDQATKGGTVQVLGPAQNLAVTSDGVDCEQYNAICVQVLVSGTNPSATLTVEGAAEQGALYLPIADPQGFQVVSANTSFDVVVGSRWVRIRLSWVTGTYPPGQGYTVWVTPYVSPGQPNVTAKHVGAGQTAYNTGIGFWLESNGLNPRMSIGDPAGNNLLWDGTNLSITGAVSITAGSVPASLVTGLGPFAPASKTTIVGGDIATSTITADKLTVASLSAISAHIGGFLDLGTGGGIYQGSGTPAAPTTGLKLYNVGGIGRLAGYNAGVEQASFDTDGRIHAGNGNVTLDVSGIGIQVVEGLPAPSRSYTFATAAGVGIGSLGGRLSSGTPIVALIADGVALNQSSLLSITAGAATSKRADASIGTLSFNVDTSSVSAGITVSSIPTNSVGTKAQVTLYGDIVTISGAPLVVGGSYASIGTNPAASGAIRLENAAWIAAKYGAGDVNLARVNASGQVELGPLKTSACQAYNNADFPIGNAADTAISFNSEALDTDSMHSVSTNTERITIVTAGLYIVTGTAVFSANATGGRQLKILLNAATPVGLSAITVRGAGTTAVTVTTPGPISLVAGDYLRLVAYQDSGGQLVATYYPGYSPYFGAMKVG